MYSNKTVEKGKTITMKLFLDWIHVYKKKYMYTIFIKKIINIIIHCFYIKIIYIYIYKNINIFYDTIFDPLPLSLDGFRIENIKFKLL